MSISHFVDFILFLDLNIQLISKKKEGIKKNEKKRKPQIFFNSYSLSMIEKISISVDRVENKYLPNSSSLSNQYLGRNEIGSTIQSGPIEETSDRVC